MEKKKQFLWCELILIQPNKINTILFDDSSNFIVWKKFVKVFFMTQMIICEDGSLFPTPTTTTTTKKKQFCT